MKRRDARVHSGVARVTFESEDGLRHAIKNGVFLGWSHLPVEPWIEQRGVLRCFRCQKYGHTIGVCTGPVRCVRCAGDCDNFRECVNPMKCLHCGGPHRSGSGICKVYREQLQKAKASKSARLFGKPERSPAARRPPRGQPRVVHGARPVPPAPSGSCAWDQPLPSVRREPQRSVEHHACDQAALAPLVEMFSQLVSTLLGALSALQPQPPLSPDSGARPSSSSSASSSRSSASASAGLPSVGDISAALFEAIDRFARVPLQRPGGAGGASVAHSSSVDRGPPPHDQQ